MVCGIIVVTTLAYGAVHQAVLAAFYVLLAVLIFFWALDCRKRGELRFGKDLLQIPLLAAAVYGFIQLVPVGTIANDAGVTSIPKTISIEPFATLTSAVHFVALAVFFAVLLTAIDSAARARKLVVFLSVFGFLYAFFAVLQAVLSPDKIYGIYGRPGASLFGSFVNRNHFAAWMEMAIALPLGMLFSGAVPKDKRLLFVTAVVLMGASIVVSGSRGGLVAFVIEVLLLSLITLGAGKKRAGLRVALAIGLLVAVVGGAVFIGGETSLTRIADSQNIPGSSQDRSQIWSVSIKIIENAMPLGVGLGAFGTAYSRFDNGSGLERVEQAHNDYLQTLTDAGAPGALIGLLFLYLLWVAGRQALSAENRYRRSLGAGAIAGIVAVLVHSAFDFVLHTTAVALIFLGLMTILVAVGRRFADEVPDEGHQHARRRRSKMDEGDLS